MSDSSKRKAKQLLEVVKHAGETAPLVGLRVEVDRFPLKHVAGVLVHGPSDVLHVAIPDDAGAPLVRWITAVAGFVRSGLNLVSAQAAARQSLLPADDVQRAGTAAGCATAIACALGVPVEVTVVRLEELGAPCCSTMDEGGFGSENPACVPTLRPCAEARIVLIQA